MKSVRAVAKGKVQGVGFRYTASDLATRVGLSGYARNNLDGTVELFIQGDPKHIENVLHELRGRFDCAIESWEIEEAEEYDYFKIIF